MTSTHHKQARTAAHLGCAAAAGYAVLKAAWAFGSTVGVRADTAAWEDFLGQVGGPVLALWGTVLLALLAGSILLSLVQPWGRRVPRRLRASLAWLGFAIMAPLGLIRLVQTLADAVAGNPFPLLTPAVYVYVYASFVVLGLTFAVTAWRTRTPEPRPASPRPRAADHVSPTRGRADDRTARTASTPDARSTMTSNTSRALRIGGWSNLAIAAGHVIGLIWAWSFFRAVGIEHEMRELATQGAALPYIFTMITAAAFVVFGLYALSGAGDLRRLPLLRAGLTCIAAVYVYRATLYEGIGAVRDGDGTQIAFAVIALLIGLCYAYGAVAHRRVNTDAAPAYV